MYTFFRKICSKSIPYSSFIPLSSIPYSELKFASPSVFKTQERRTQQPSNWLTFLCSKLHEPTLRKIFQTSVLTIILFDKAPFGGKKGTLCKFSIECKLKRPLLASPCKKFDWRPLRHFLIHFWLDDIWRGF